MTQDKLPAFRVGLAMAGAVSAGAYTAGVLDFLFEALDAWYEARARGAAVPRHEVALEVASGASAGAMCAALLAVLLPHRFPHVRVAADGTVSADHGADPARNPLYNAWVRQIGIEPLLDNSDLEQSRLESLLNCEVIDRIMRDSLAWSGPPQERPWIRRPFAARFTLGNLRGVPYKIDFLGPRKLNEEAMIEHADYREFRIGRGSDGRLPAGGLEAVSAGDDGWDELGAAAVASGAYPLFLRPRLIGRGRQDYDARHFVQSSLDSSRPQAIDPAWRAPEPDPYEFAAVDGGMFNNEPFELARELLAGGPGKAIPQTAQQADAAVLMLDPFMAIPGNGEAPPTFADPQTGERRLQLPPERQLLPLVNSWIRQARFKPADLAQAYDESVYSRFVIAPYGSRSPDAARYWIASGGLGGFLGFFHEDFRKHDYQLGRRNCQQFLREHFTLPADNEVVRRGYAALGPEQVKVFSSQDGQLQIIPLMEALRPDVGLMDWPAGVFEPAQVMPQLERRLDAVFAHYRGQLAAAASDKALLRAACRLGLSAAWRMVGRKRLAAGIAAALEQARAGQCL